MLRQKLHLLVSSAVKKAEQLGDLPHGANAEVEILITTGDGRGDFACAIAPKLAGVHGAKSLAQAIAKWLNSELLERVEVAENGFINLFVSKHALCACVQNIITELPVHQDCPSVSKNDFDGLVYARHRLSASLRQLTEPRLNLEENSLAPPLIDKEQWSQMEGLYAGDMRLLEPAFDSALIKSELALTNKRIALLLDEFSVADRCRKDKMASFLRSYLDVLAKEITQSNFLDGLPAANSSVRNARIGLILAAKRVFLACLGILNLAVSETI